MDTGTGRIRELENNERPLPTEALLTMIEADYLAAVAEKDRPAEYKALHSHNNAKKRRARRRMIKASKRKNR